MYRMLLLVILCATLLGCSRSPITISGKITLDGNPVERGTITFEAQDKQTANAGGVVTQGAYNVKDIPPGKKIVRITGLKVTGERLSIATDPNSKKIEDTVPIVPARFNDQSDLVRDVTTSTTMDFDLKTKP
jgi:hypothetical protein